MMRAGRVEKWVARCYLISAAMTKADAYLGQSELSLSVSHNRFQQLQIHNPLQQHQR
jgi:hypothetical protein